MSDYLSNLAARSLRLAEVVLPRLPSRFEPISLSRQPFFGRCGRDIEGTSESMKLEDSQFTERNEELEPFAGSPHPPHLSKDLQDRSKNPLDLPEREINDAQLRYDQRSSPPMHQEPEWRSSPSLKETPREQTLFEIEKMDIEAISVEPGFDNSHSNERSADGQFSAFSQYVSDALKKETSDIQVRYDHASRLPGPQQPEKISSSSLNEALEDRLQSRDISQEKPSSHMMSLSMAQSIDALPSDAKLSGSLGPGQPDSKPIDRRAPVKTADIANPSKFVKSGQVMDALHKNATEKEMLSSLKPGKKEITTKEAALEPPLAADVDRDEGIPHLRSTAKEERLPAMVPPIQNIIAEKTLEASPRMNVSSPSEPASTKRQPSSISRTIMAKPHTRTHVQQAESDLIKSTRRQDPEPTIQVTIGRIEVRAMSAPVKLKSERRKSPAGSLEKYLQSRGGR